MASKGRYVASQSLAEKIYWQRTYDREIRRTDWYPFRPTPAQQQDVTDRAWARAEAIAARYQRMKRHKARIAKGEE